MIGGLLQLLDVPGSMVRDTLALRNPLDQLLHPLSHQDRGLSTSGSERQPHGVRHKASRVAKEF